MLINNNNMPQINNTDTIQPNRAEAKALNHDEIMKNLEPILNDLSAEMKESIEKTMARILESTKGEVSATDLKFLVSSMIDARVKTLASDLGSSKPKEISPRPGDLYGSIQQRLKEMPTEKVVEVINKILQAPLSNPQGANKLPTLEEMVKKFPNPTELQFQISILKMPMASSLSIPSLPDKVKTDLESASLEQLENIMRTLKVLDSTIETRIFKLTLAIHEAFRTVGARNR